MGYRAALLIVELRRAYVDMAPGTLLADLATL